MTDVSPTRRFSPEALPDEDEFREYVKRGTTRIAGPFPAPVEVVTATGLHVVGEGMTFVAVDEAGFPYPVRPDVMDASYTVLSDPDDDPGATAYVEIDLPSMPRPVGQETCARPGFDELAHVTALVLEDAWALARAAGADETPASLAAALTFRVRGDRWVPDEEAVRSREALSRGLVLLHAFAAYASGQQDDDPEGWTRVA